MFTKKCTNCGEEKPTSEFGPRKEAKDGLRYHCNTCRASIARDWRVRNPKKAREVSWRQQGIPVSFGEYEAMLESQGGVCAVCEGIVLDGRTLHVDHDHVTGRVRGILCARHNHGIGLFNDNAALLRKAADYLESTNGVQ